MKNPFRKPILDRSHLNRHLNGCRLPSRPKKTRTIGPAFQTREILVPTDFSESSNFALKYAMSFAKLLHARITLLHVLEPLSLPDMGYYQFPGVPGQAARIAEQSIARTWEREKARRSLTWRSLVKEGAPDQVILQTAKAEKTDLIILATRGRTGLAHAVLGSTAEKVVRQAPCPVLVVRLQTRNDESKSNHN